MTHKESRQRRATMAQRVDNGEPPTDVATAFNVSPERVYEACHKHGVTWDDGRSSRVHRVHPFAVLAKLRNGGTLQSIADEVGITRQGVHKVKVLAVKFGVL